MQLLAQFDLHTWMHHAPQSAGSTAVVALILLVLLVFALPRSERRQALQPAIFQLVAWFILLAEEVVVESLQQSLPAIALLLLFASIGRSTFLLAIIALEKSLHKTFPKIFLDFAMAAIYLAIGYAALRIADVKAENIVAGSAVISIVLGLALQSTLGNFFAGLAMQMQQPFAIGEWIQFNDRREHIGKVTDSNWRATTVVTLDQIEVVIPNNKLADLPLSNFNRPFGWSRRSIYFVCPYAVPPGDVQEIILAAISGSFGVLAHPAASVVTNAFTERGIEYWLRFFTTDFDQRDRVDGGVRDRVWYALHRAGITMPIAAHDVTLTHRTHEVDLAVAHRESAHREEILRATPLFSNLPHDALLLLGAESRKMRFRQGETIIQQGSQGTDLFIIDAGEVGVYVCNESGVTSLLENLGPRAFFGEMSLLIGAPRTATVIANTNCELLVVEKPSLASVFQRQPEFVREISDVVASRQAMLAARQAELAVEPAGDKPSLLDQIRAFFGLR